MFPLAAFRLDDWDGVVVPVVSLLIFVLLPIVAMLTHHQRKMAELMRHSGDGNALRSEVEGLRGQIDELKQFLVSQAPALSEPARPPKP